jgi:hypothetical protein
MGQARLPSSLACLSLCPSGASRHTLTATATTHTAGPSAVKNRAQLWVLFGAVDMTSAALKRDPTGRSPGCVFYDMFKCWRDAFEDFVPGVKAEWKQVFNNRVSGCDAAAANVIAVCCSAAGVAQGSLRLAGLVVRSRERTTSPATQHELHAQSVIQGAIPDARSVGPSATDTSRWSQQTAGIMTTMLSARCVETGTVNDCDCAELGTLCQAFAANCFSRRQ